MTVDVRSLYSQSARSSPPLFFPDPDRPISFNFDQGNPDPATFPLELLEQLGRAVIDDVGGAALSYFDHSVGYEELVFGFRGLRNALANHLGDRDQRSLTPENFILTSGAVQALSLAARAFTEPGDAVFTEAVTFPYATSFFNATGATVVPVPVDENGLDVDALIHQVDEVTAKGLRPKLLYTIATFQLPTGMSMGEERRRRLMDFATARELLVIEDNVYYDLRYEGTFPPTLFSMDDSGLVMQCDSFSKTVAPGLRLGWMAGSAETVAGLAAVRQDLGVSQFIAQVMTRFLRGGHMEEQLTSIRDRYRTKRDVAVAALRKHCEPHVTFRVPQGSFFLWLELADGVDWNQVAAKVQEEGVFCRPGERFSGQDSGRRFLRLAFSLPEINEIERGIEALGRALGASTRS